MKHPLKFLLRLGRSDDERGSLLGDLEEEHRARLASGSSRLAAFAWYTAEILRAFLWGMRDTLGTFRSRGSDLTRSTEQPAPGRRSILSWPDVKLSFRLLIRNPGLTIVSTIGITVAVAITAGTFGFLQSIFAPTIPLDEGDRIVALENWNVARNNANRRVLHDFVAWRDQMTSVIDISAYRTITEMMRAGEWAPDNVRIAEMSASGFQVARVPALLGRFLTPDDERSDAPAVVVIDHGVWKSRFGQDPSVIGQQVRFDETPHTIVGVMPEGFGFPVNHQYWIPLRAKPSAIARGAGPALFVFGRLAPGATIESAQAELSVVGQRTAAAFPKTNATLKPVVLGYTKPIYNTQDKGIGTWVMMQLAISLVLVVIALNVAILLYARTATRRGEITMRTALGASRGRIVIQLFIEALVLALLPALLGLALGRYLQEIGTGIMVLELDGATPFWLDRGIQPSTVVYVLGSVVLMAAIAGILPALHATRRRAGADIRQLGGSTGMRLGRLWNALIVVQVAFAVAVLPAAIKFGAREIRSSLTAPTYPIEEFVDIRLAMDSADLFGSRLLEVKRRLQAEPEVVGVTFTASLPQRDSTGRIEVEGIQVQGVPAPTGSNRVTTFGIDSDYLDVYGLRVVAGRSFNALDASASNGPVIVDRSFVQQLLRGESAVGRRIRYVASSSNELPSPWYEIVGVVDDMWRNPIDPDVVSATVLYPVTAEQLAVADLAVRLRGSATSRMDEGFARKVHEIRAAVDPDPGLRMGEVRLSANPGGQDALAVRLVAIALSLTLLTVLLFSAAGVYSLMSFTVAQRRREIGIRAALGASQLGVLRGVFSRVAVLIGMGVIVGALGAMVIAPAIEGVVLSERLAIVTPAIALTMALVGAVAAYGPARRSLRIQPSEALRPE
jgi:putative ABC transport system permease protein